MKLKRWQIAAVAAIMLLPTRAFALGVNDADTYYNSDSKVFHITGNGDFAYQPVKGTMLEIGTDFGSLTDTDFDKLKYVKQIQCDSNGAFVFDIPAEDAGIYEVSITGMNNANPIILNFATYTDEQVAEDFSSYISNQSSIGDDLKNLVEAYYPKLGITYDELTRVDDDTADTMYTLINQNKPDEVEELLNTVKGNFAIALMNCSSDADAVAAFIKYAEYLDVMDSACYTDFITLELNKQIEIYKNIGNNVALDAFDDCFINEFVLYTLENALWNQVPDLTKKYINVDINKYLKTISTTAQKDVIAELIKRINNDNLTDVSSIEPLIKSLVKEYQDTSNNSTGNSGGGGGGGGGAIGIVHTPAVIPQQPQAPVQQKGAFDDLNGTEWAKEAIEALYKKGVVNGKSDRQFMPQDLVTREEFVKMLVLSLDIQNEDASCNFRDVDNSQWYYSYISTANSLGIINGKSELQFGIGENITRQDMAVMIYNALKYKEVLTDITEENAAFDDIDDVADYAKGSVNALSKEKILNGADNKVEPLRNATRAEAAKLIFSCMKFCEVK